jgi:hypothetical protein
MSRGLWLTEVGAHDVVRESWSPFWLRILKSLPLWPVQRESSPVVIWTNAELISAQNAISFDLLERLHRPPEENPSG